MTGPPAAATISLWIFSGLSILGCLLSLTIYAILVTSRKYRRAALRPTLALVQCIALSDLAGTIVWIIVFTPPPKGFRCSVLGWMYSLSTLLTMGYSCCIAFNTQLIFVFNRRPKRSFLKYYLVAPLVIMLAITLPALISGWYGFDAKYGICAWKTGNWDLHITFLRQLSFHSIPMFVMTTYLVLATISVSAAVSTSSFVTKIIPASSSQEADHDGHSVSSRAITASHMLKSTQISATRKLTYRLIGYCVIPVFGFLPLAVINIISRAEENPPNVPPNLTFFFVVISALVGLANTILIMTDPVIMLFFKDIFSKPRSESGSNRGNANFRLGGRHTHTLSDSSTPVGNKEGQRSFWMDEDLARTIHPPGGISTHTSRFDLNQGRSAKPPPQSPLEPPSFLDFGHTTQQHTASSDVYFLSQASFVNDEVGVESITRPTQLQTLESWFGGL